MASRAQGYEILFRVIAQQAARLHVMDLKICSGTTILALPSVPLEYPSVQFLV